MEEDGFLDDDYVDDDDLYDYERLDAEPVYAEKQPSETEDGGSSEEDDDETEDVVSVELAEDEEGPFSLRMMSRWFRFIYGTKLFSGFVPLFSPYTSHPSRFIHIT